MLMSLFDVWWGYVQDRCSKDSEREKAKRDKVFVGYESWSKCQQQCRYDDY